MLLDLFPTILSRGVRVVLASASPRRRELLLSVVGLPVTVVDVRPSGFPENLDKEKFSPAEYALTNAFLKALDVIAADARTPKSREGTLVSPYLLISCDTVVVHEGRILEKPADDTEAAKMLRGLSGQKHAVVSGVCVVSTLPGPCACRGTAGSASTAAEGLLPAGLTIERLPLAKFLQRESAPADDKGASVPGTACSAAGAGGSLPEASAATLVDEADCSTAASCSCVTVAKWSVSTGVQFAAIPDAVIAAYVATGEPRDKAGGYGIQSRAGTFVSALEGDYYNVVGLPVASLCSVMRHLIIASEDGR